MLKTSVTPDGDALALPRSDPSTAGKAVPSAAFVLSGLSPIALLIWPTDCEENWLCIKLSMFIVNDLSFVWNDAPQQLHVLQRLEFAPAAASENILRTETFGRSVGSPYPSA